LGFVVGIADRDGFLRAICWCLIVFFSLFPGMVGAEGPGIKPGTATVSYLHGKAEVLRRGQEIWGPVWLGMVLREGDRVRTLEGSRLELTLEDKTVIRLAESSSFLLTKLRTDQRGKATHSRLFLFLGKVWANVNRLIFPPSTFEIQTQVAIAGTRSTIYRLSILSDSSTVIKVYEGSVGVGPVPTELGPPAEVGGPSEVTGPVPIAPPYHEVTPEEWVRIVVGKMQQVSISPEGIFGAPEKIVGEAGEEEWVAWNQERDRLLPRPPHSLR